MDEESTNGCGWRCRWPVMDEYSCRGRRKAVNVGGSGRG